MDKTPSKNGEGKSEAFRINYPEKVPSLGQDAGGQYRTLFSIWVKKEHGQNQHRNYIRPIRMNVRFCALEFGMYSK